LELVADGTSLFLSIETLLIKFLEMSANATLQVQFGDNTVINGKMPFNCSLAPAGTSCSSDATYSKFRVQTGKTYKIRLVNPGAGSVQWFSIDNHELTIIANDFVDLVPYTTTMVTLGVSFPPYEFVKAC
jgi:FtsP/CotA-like multicopper oxidase with cupredoxin domain